MPDGPNGLFLTCGQNKRVSHTHTCLLLYLTHYHNSFYTLSVGSTAANESILALFSKQAELFYPPYGTGRSAASHQQLGLGFSAWLAQIMLLITAPTQTLINHTDTHHDYMARVYCYKAKHAHTFLFLIKFISIIINIYTYLHTFSYSRC